MSALQQCVEALIATLSNDTQRILHQPLRGRDCDRVIVGCWKEPSLWKETLWISRTATYGSV